MLKQLLSFAVTLCWASNLMAAPSVHASPVVNLIYQLDCVSQRIKSCGNRDGYVALWRLRFGIDTARDSDIAAWANLPPRLPEKDEGSTRSTDPTLLRIASFEVGDVGQYIAKIRPLFERLDWEAADRIIRRVHPAFDDWWKERAAAPLARHVVELQDELQSGGLADELAHLHTFFGVPNDPATDLSLQLIRRVIQSPTSSGETIGKYAVLEMDDDGFPAQGIPVAVHEYSHFLFAQITPARKQRLHDRILGTSSKQPSLERLSAWNLFNEALATAIGNGRVARAILPIDFAARMSRPGGLYNDNDVDAAAKALLPILDRVLENQEMIDQPDFADSYVTALTAAIGPRLTAPRLLLQELAVFADSSLVEGDGTLARMILKIISTNHSLGAIAWSVVSQNSSAGGSFTLRSPG